MLDGADMKSDRADGARALRANSGKHKKEVSILELLYWAFQREFADVSFDVYRDTDQIPPSYGMEYILMQQAQLGCRVDTSRGSTDPHIDAQMVANALAVLPEGRHMAIHIADLARVGLVPDWAEDDQPRIYPDEWHVNRYGKRGKTNRASRLGSAGWPDQPRRNKKGVIVHDEVKFTPCHWHPTGAGIARARRDYLGWWGALLSLSTTFQICNNLTCYWVTDEMPPMSPWKKKC